MSTSPFDTAIQNAKAREERNAMAAKTRADRLAEQREKNKQIEDTRRKAAELQFHLGQFSHLFQVDVITHGDRQGWVVKTVEDVRKHCEALISHDNPNESSLPRISPELTKLIRSKFAYQATRFVGKIPSTYFWGQRQDWMTEEVRKLRGHRDPETKPIKIEKPRLGDTATPAKVHTSQSTPKTVELPPATTPRSKRDNRPGHGHAATKKMANAV